MSVTPTNLHKNLDFLFSETRVGFSCCYCSGVCLFVLVPPSRLHISALLRARKRLFLGFPLINSQHEQKIELSGGPPQGKNNTCLFGTLKWYCTCWQWLSSPEHHVFFFHEGRLEKYCILTSGYHLVLQWFFCSFHCSWKSPSTAHSFLIMLELFGSWMYSSTRAGRGSQSYICILVSEAGEPLSKAAMANFFGRCAEKSSPLGAHFSNIIRAPQALV